MFDEIGGLSVGGGVVAVLTNDSTFLPFEPLEEGDDDIGGSSDYVLELGLDQAVAANCTFWNQTFLFNGTNFTCGNILTTEGKCCGFFFLR